MAKTLVIVESPAKARTIERILKEGYEVLASYGHVRDLPESADEIPDEIRKEKWGRLGVDTEGDFRPYYVIPNDKRKYVQALKTALKGASQLYLATDPDREGESISWHLKEILKPRVPVKRIVFHEITKEAIKQAVKDAHDVDENLVRAQESRRILDRLYGYTISPVLWKKVQTGLSAGRVQSVAVRLIVNREEERLAFRPATYWDLEARFSGEGREFTATLARLDDERVATGKDFDAQGVLVGRNVRVLTEADGTALVDALWTHLPWTVTAVDEKPGVERPAPPFTTSTLTQEASRKLGFSTERTMQAAQRLFQEGHISYHRTDSTTLSEKALGESAAAIRGMFGDEYHSGPRRYATKVKNAQEAHEAIRPSNFSATPTTVGLDRDDYKVYELIWKRTMASQMVDARVLRTTVEITGRGVDGQDAFFTASGKAIEFAGFRRAYVEGSDDPAAELEEQETVLPKLTVGERVDRGAASRVQALALEPKRHETSPPARYTEASLIKALEELGIGRPSTYSSIIKTIQDRGYVHKKGSALVPSWVAFAVTGLLEQHFGRLVDYDFTAAMEDELDEIASGNERRTNWLNNFYFGGEHGVDGSIARSGGLKKLVGGNLEGIDAREVNSIKLFDDDQGRAINVRVGRNGPYLERMITGDDGEPTPQRANLKDDLTPDELTIELAEKLFSTPQEGRSLGVDPESGHEVVAKDGRYGPYVTEVLPEPPEPPEDPDAGVGAKKAKKPTGPKPRTGSLLRSMDLETVTLEDALRLLSLPRVVGVDPANNEEITAQNGRYGPYLKRGTDSRSLANEDQMFTVTLEEALKIYAEPKRRGGQGAATPPLRELGTDPVSEKPMVIKDGRFGPYVTDGETNASLRKGDDVLSITDGRASELLADRRARGPAKKTAKKAAAKKAPAKKAPAKKAVKKS